MKRIDITLTPEARHSAETALIKRGFNVPAVFLGPVFIPKAGEELESVVENDVYYVLVRPTSPVRGAKCASPAVRYIYPLHTINRIKETL